VAWSLASHRALAVPMLRPGYESDYDGRPPVFEVMGAGRIVAEEKLPDGRWNLLVRGTDRVRLTHEWPPDETFRLIRAERLPTIAGDELDVATGARRLRAVVDRVGQATPRAREPLSRLLTLLKSPGELADVVAAHLVADADARQGILEELDLAVRLKLVTDAVATLLLGLGNQGGGGPPTLH
jgi:Lon protease-like protein